MAENYGSPAEVPLVKKCTWKISVSQTNGRNTTGEILLCADAVFYQLKASEVDGNDTQKYLFPFNKVETQKAKGIFTLSGMSLTTCLFVFYLPSQ